MSGGQDQKIDIDPDGVRQAALTVATALARAATPMNNLPMAGGVSPADVAATAVAAAVQLHVATSSAELMPKGPEGQAKSEAAVSGFETTDTASAANLAAVSQQAMPATAAAQAAPGGAGGMASIFSTFSHVIPAVAQLANSSSLAGAASSPISALSGMAGAPVSPPTAPTPTPSASPSNLPPYQDDTGVIHPRSGPYDPPLPEPKPTYGPPALPPYDPSGPPNDGAFITGPGDKAPYGYYEKVPGSGRWYPPPSPPVAGETVPS
jgi:hypothetical protein